LCFDRRFEVSAHKALEIGEKSFTTTLLVSPLKSQEQLKRSGKIFYEKYALEFIAVDYRSDGGTQEQSRVTKEQQLYRQDYCGCIYGLTMQREQQNRIMDEMFSPISNLTLPASIEERLELYKQRISLENDFKNYKIIKQKFLNYRQLNFKLIKGKKEVIPAYAISYSTLPRKRTQGKVDFEHNEIYYFNRDEVRFLTLEKFNKMAQTSYNNIKELVYTPLSFDKELTIRKKISQTEFDLSPIIIVEEILRSKLTIILNAKCYEDTKESIIRLT